MSSSVDEIHGMRTSRQTQEQLQDLCSRRYGHLKRVMWTESYEEEMVMFQEKEEWISASPSTAASPGASSVHVSKPQSSERFADASLGDPVPAMGLRAVSIPAEDSVSTASVIMHRPTTMHVTQVTNNSPDTHTASLLHPLHESRLELQSKSCIPGNTLTTVSSLEKHTN